MAKVRTGSGTAWSVRRFLGLNENRDGDTELKLGEASVMRNFRVTPEGSLQLRPGFRAVCSLAEGSPVRGLWSGYVNGTKHLLCACGGKVWDLDSGTWEASELGAVADGQITFLGFSNSVYLLDGTEYYVWTGEGELTPVEGYVPIIATATPPAGGGTLLEEVNKLTGKKRQQFSPNGSATVFHLAETAIDRLDGVKVNGTLVTSGYASDLAAGTVTFTAAPAAGVNTLEIAWTKGTGDRAKVTGMRFCELYNGAQYSRVFLYGDGTNQALYSGLDEDGKPSAEYFPDLNVLDAGDENTPITGLIRHFSRLIVYKRDSAFSVTYSTLTLTDGTVTAGFYVTPINRAVGHEAAGQMVLVENNPWSLFGGAAYEWKPASTGLTNDERQARRRSDRVRETLRSFDLEQCLLFDDNERQELYLCCGDRALLYNYAADAWYAYENFPAACMISVDGALYFGTTDGRVMHLSRDHHSDNGAEIDARWESGALSFDRNWREKSDLRLWLTLKPESQARITAELLTDRRADNLSRTAASGLSTLTHVNFGHWSFATNRSPRTVRVRLRTGTFTYCKLILTSLSASAAATVLSADLQVRYAGTII